MRPGQTVVAPHPPPEMEKLWGVVNLEVVELASARAAELAHSTGILFNPGKINTEIAAGTVYTGAGGAAPRSRALGL